MVAAGRKPFVANHGVPEREVSKRVSGDDFAAFYAR
jgi:hypothetical protein